MNFRIVKRHLPCYNASAERNVNAVSFGMDHNSSTVQSMASTVWSSLLRSDSHWTSEGHFSCDVTTLLTLNLHVTPIDVNFISNFFTNRSDVNRSDMQMISH